VLKDGYLVAVQFLTVHFDLEAALRFRRLLVGGNLLRQSVLTPYTEVPIRRRLQLRLLLAQTRRILRRHAHGVQ